MSKHQYRLLADVCFWFHWVWVALLLGGIPMSIAYEWYKPIHNVVLTTTIVSQLIWLGCPLVALENALRRKYDPDQAYTGSFIAHYLSKRLGRPISPIAITASLVVVTIVSVTIFWF